MLHLKNAFFHFEYFLPILLIVSFAVQMLLSLTRTYLLFFFFFIKLGSGSKNLLMSKSISPMYSSSNCIVLSVTYRSFVHFDFIFVYDIVGQLSQHHYWRDCLFSLYILAIFVADICHFWISSISFWFFLMIIIS